MELQVISPFPIEALPRVYRWISSFKEKVADDFGPRTLEDFVAHMTQQWEAGRSWGVYGDGELGGLITYWELTPWVGTAHFLLKPEFQRAGLAVKAARIAAQDIFDNERIGKLVFYPLAGNLAVGHLLINLGAKREGMLAGHTLVGGKPTDMWVYGLTREGFINANISHRSRDRRDQLDPGGSLGGQGKDLDPERHNDADILAGNAGAHDSARELLELIDSQPDVNARSNAGAGPRQDQPAV